MIYFDNVARKLQYNTKSTRLGFREALVLECLLAHAPETVSKQTLICTAWGSEYIGHTSLAKSISALRRGLLAIGADTAIVVTVPKQGYRMVEGVMETITADEPQAMPDPHEENIPPVAIDAVTDKPRVPDKAVMSKPIRQCVIMALMLLVCVASSVFVVGKINNWRWSDLVQRGGLTQKRVGSLYVFYPQDTRLDFPMEQFLTYSQCDCLVYLEKKHKYATMHFVSRKTHRSVLIRYSPFNVAHATSEIKQFLSGE
ncbi:transcriptional regulator [Salinivibrio sp. ES.052]|uniref:transcriptional regulator n=1 Tax=Salinivibrio sp. ES.052 TaxID=1882823 RepID=UPI000929C8EC|nr:winged helix-turn-helix domain-containing protein [Salinivibrio sp. ES.052]SIN90288.1 DNA-binding winged helix-turn-helix (wHTH) domain-containing protein [Salinivibrio sp. ES.052]